jgi:YD repeat-containing protein
VSPIIASGGPKNLGIEWNAENQLIEVLENETTIATFGYDPMGRRVEKV